MTSVVQFYYTPLSIISIPLDSYVHFFHGIVKLITQSWVEEYKILCQNDESLDLISTAEKIKRLSLNSIGNDSNIHADQDDEKDMHAKTIDDLIEEMCDFINISFTPVECSVICPEALVDLLFGSAFKESGSKVLSENYMAMQVDGEGSSSGYRLLDITAPLSSAGIPIFFIPTYFSDYVLVPYHAKSSVLKALETLGFRFSNLADSYVDLSHNLPLTKSNSPPLSPNLESLDKKAFEHFNSKGVEPVIESETDLIITGARPHRHSVHLHSALYLNIIQTIISPPKYFSLSVTSRSEISFIIDSTVTCRFPQELQLGYRTDFLIPIQFDLSKLPEDSTGIVAGVASRLLNWPSTSKTILQMSYLSTAKSGIVMIAKEDLQLAIDALK